MIPRYQRILFWSLCALIVLMTAFTIRERQKARERILASNDALPYIPPVDVPGESIPLMLANDVEDTLTSGLREAALPAEPSLRAHALLDRLFVEYTLPISSHPLKPGPAIDEVFLLTPPATAGPSPSSGSIPGLLAVVNFHSAFTDSHPSGIAVETLTLLSVVGTLHANFPQIAEVRFLIDGQPRETLAGHADLTRSYPATDPSLNRTQPVETREP